MNVMFSPTPAFIKQLNDMSFWYPIIDELALFSTMPNVSMTMDKETKKITSTETEKDFVLRSPKTKMFYAPRVIGRVTDGDKVPEFNDLVVDISDANKELGDESFLRTGQTSNKHEWDKTCHLTKDSNIGNHLFSLIEFSMMVDLPYTTYAVREMIPTNAVTTAFSNMPIAREVRVFAKSCKIVCAHPYWPEEAFKNGVYTDNKVTDEQIAELQVMPDMTEINKIAEYVSKSFLGGWSIDFLQDKDGNWWLTDMALASTSYHWESCEHKTEFKDI